MYAFLGRKSLPTKQHKNYGFRSTEEIEQYFNVNKIGHNNIQLNRNDHIPNSPFNGSVFTYLPIRPKSLIISCTWTTIFVLCPGILTASQKPKSKLCEPTYLPTNLPTLHISSGHFQFFHHSAAKREIKIKQYNTGCLKPHSFRRPIITTFTLWGQSQYIRQSWIVYEPISSKSICERSQRHAFCNFSSGEENCNNKLHWHLLSQNNAICFCLFFF